MANPKKGTSQARNEFIWGWAFILPTMLGLIILNIYPIFKTIYESFFKTGDFGKGNIFIGFDNYVNVSQFYSTDCQGSYQETYHIGPKE